MSLCQIIREKSFEIEFQEIAKKYARIHDLESAIDWALERQPGRFNNITDNLFIWKMEKFSEHFPQLMIAYVYEKELNTIHLVSVKEVQNNNY